MNDLLQIKIHAHQNICREYAFLKERKYLCKTVNPKENKTKRQNKRKYSTSKEKENANRPFATNDHMVQSPPCWRASLLLFPQWDIKTKASHA